MVPVKSFMVPREKFVTVERDTNAQAAARIMRDRGIGIPAEDNAKLFQMFQRASNVGTISGSGLGLVIVKRCVDLHGGTIEIESEPERGTTVTVRFPQPSLAGAEGI